MIHRAVSVAIVPLTAIPFAAGALNPLLDGIFIGLLIIHSYMGFQYADRYTPNASTEDTNESPQELHY